MPPHDDSGVPVHIQKLLLDQQEANERLVLATIRAQELQDEADRATHMAEEALRSAEVATEIAQALAEDLEKRERELRATAEFREQLLAIVSHDLRNPLQSIAMATQLLEMRAALNEADAKLVARVRNSAQRMARMIAQLLDFTRARIGGGLTIDLKPTSFREVCRHVVDELEIGASVQVRSDAQGELTGTWDADRLAQVLSNVIGNAIDHATPGTAVFITASENSAEVLVEISNHGEPIPPDVLPIIFQPFRRGRHQIQSQRGHLGLGLFIADQVVSGHGGSLMARSAGGITTFSIRLPRYPALGRTPPEQSDE